MLGTLFTNAHAFDIIYCNQGEITMAKSTQNISQLQFDRDPLVNAYLDDSLKYLKDHCKNPLIREVISKMPNFFNTYSSSRWDDNAAKIQRSKVFTQENNNTSLATLARFNQYDDECRINENLINVYAKMLQSGVAVDKSSVEIFQQLALGKDSFLRMCMQYGMQFNLNGDLLGRLMDNDSKVGKPGHYEYIYKTPEAVKTKWAQESDFVDAMHYMQKLGFVTTLLGDVSRRYNGSVSEDQKRELLNVFQLLSKPEYTFDKEFSESLYKRTMYDGLVEEYGVNFATNYIYGQMLQHVIDANGKKVDPREITKLKNTNEPASKFTDFTDISELYDESESAK